MKTSIKFQVLIIALWMVCLWGVLTYARFEYDKSLRLYRTLIMIQRKTINNYEQIETTRQHKLDKTYSNTNNYIH